MIDDPEIPLEEDELDALGERLAERAGDDGLLLDGVHGLLTALSIGPGEVAAEQWLGAVIDRDQPFEDESEARQTITMLLRFHQAVLRELESLEYEPILGHVEEDDGSPHVSAAGWCEGFSAGVDLGGAAWEQRMQNDPQLLELLGPIVQLAAEEELFDLGDGVAVAPLSDAEYESALDGIAASVLDVQQYWREHPVAVDEGGESTVGGKDSERVVPRRRGGRWVH